MEKYIVVNKTSGEILQRCYVVPEDLALYNNEFQEIILDAGPFSATHCIEGTYSTLVPTTPTDLLLKNIRNKRNSMLNQCDWTQTIDAPLTPEQKAEWTLYRKALRDFPDTCDPENPIWPTPPA